MVDRLLLNDDVDRVLKETSFPSRVQNKKERLIAERSLFLSSGASTVPVRQKSKIKIKNLFPQSQEILF